MSDWTGFELRWTGTVPSAAALKMLNEEIYDVDCDAPHLTKEGFLGAWRSPSYSVMGPKEIASICTKAGYPCKYRYDNIGHAKDISPCEYLHAKPWTYIIQRDPTWGQDTPRMQVTALVQAVQGDLMNAQEGVGDLKSQLERCLKFLGQAQEILKVVPEGSWTGE